MSEPQLLAYTTVRMDHLLSFFVEKSQLMTEIGNNLKYQKLSQLRYAYPFVFSVIIWYKTFILHGLNVSMFFSCLKLNQMPLYIDRASSELLFHQS